MLTDYSPGYADTWESLGRRCQEMEGMSKLSKRVSHLHWHFQIMLQKDKSLVGSYTFHRRSFQVHCLGLRRSRASPG